MTPDERRAELSKLLLEQHDAQNDLRLLRRRIHGLGETLRSVGDGLVRAAEARDVVMLSPQVVGVDWGAIAGTIDEYNATMQRLERLRADITGADD